MIRLALILAALAGPASAVQQCGNADAMISALRDKYGEAPIMRGAPDVNGWRGEVWASPESKTWTMLVIREDVLCVLAAGEGAVLLPPPKPGEDT